MAETPNGQAEPTKTYRAAGKPIRVKRPATEKEGQK